MPTYSEMTMTVTTDFVIGDTITIVTSSGSKPFEWVATRSGAGEVTTGTPTATAGEQSCIDLESAYDLDNPSGYVTTQTTNTLQIQSETLNEDFLGVVFDQNNTGVFTVAYNNYVAPFDLTTVSLALTRSPYYINTPFDFSTTTKATIELKIWNGDITTDEPADPTITITKIRPTVDFSEFNTDISKLVKDYLDAIPNPTLSTTSDIIDSTNDMVKWVKYTASYTDATTSIADITGTLLATDGYGRYAEGVNPGAPSDQILTSCDRRKVARQGIILLPFINDSTITSIDVDSDGAEINDNHTITSSNETTDYIQYVEIAPDRTTNDTLITVTFNPSGDTVLYDIIDECRYTPVSVIFKNRYGAYEVFTLFKKKMDTVSIEKDEFVNNYISSGTYNAEKHQFKDLNVESKRSTTLNTGYLEEDENELIREMLESDAVWFFNISDNSLTPVRPTLTSWEQKTRTNDKLIEYAITFEYAYSEIQNV